MYAYDPSEWSDLFVASAGATAALAGLLFVAVSINLERIIGEAGLPDRALETVLLLVGVLVVSILGEAGAPAMRAWLLSRWGIRAFALAPLIVGGASLMTSDGGGLYWIVAGIVFATVGAVANAWVLLVEILR